MNRIIELEDHGQDFIYWTIDSTNTVIDCRPFQGQFWIGTKIENTEIHPGDTLMITIRRSKEIKSLNYPVKTIKAQCSAGRDGECIASDCPQHRDNEPATTSRHCPIDNYQGES